MGRGKKTVIVDKRVKKMMGMATKDKESSIDDQRICSLFNLINICRKIIDEMELENTLPLVQKSSKYATLVYKIYEDRNIHPANYMQAIKIIENAILDYMKIIVPKIRPTLKDLNWVTDSENVLYGGAKKNETYSIDLRSLFLFSQKLKDNVREEEKELKDEDPFTSIQLPFRNAHYLFCYRIVDLMIKFKDYPENDLDMKNTIKLHRALKTMENSTVRSSPSDLIGMITKNKTIMKNMKNMMTPEKTKKIANALKDGSPESIENLIKDSSSDISGMVKDFMNDNDNKPMQDIVKSFDKQFDNIKSNISDIMGDDEEEEAKSPEPVKSEQPPQDTKQEVETVKSEQPPQEVEPVKSEQPHQDIKQEVEPVKSETPSQPHQEVEPVKSEQPPQEVEPVKTDTTRQPQIEEVTEDSTTTS